MLRALVEQLQVELLRVQLELERYKKWYYGPRADRLQSDQDVAQMLLNFAEDWIESRSTRTIFRVQRSLPKSCVA